MFARVLDAGPELAAKGIVYTLQLLDGQLTQITSNDRNLLVGDWVEVLGIELLLRYRPPQVPSVTSDFLRSANRGLPGRLHQRDIMRRSVRGFFQARDYLEIDTPRFALNPGMDPHLFAFEVAGTDKYLVTSPEYHLKRAVTLGIGNCYQLSTVFRRDEVGTHHLPEFTMLEWYQLFADAAAMMDETEALVREVSRSVRPDLRIKHRGVEVDLNLPFERLRIADLFSRLLNIDAHTLPGDQFFEHWVTTIEPHLVTKANAVFVTDFPVRFASLARPHPQNPEVAERFELYVAGVELSNGFCELTDATELRRRWTEQTREREANKSAVYPFDEALLDAMDQGLPPCAGNAVGFDRLVMLATHADSIADVVAFTE